MAGNCPSLKYLVTVDLLMRSSSACAARKLRQPHQVP